MQDILLCSRRCLSSVRAVQYHLCSNKQTDLLRAALLCCYILFSILFDFYLQDYTFLSVLSNNLTEKRTYHRSQETITKTKVAFFRTAVNNH